MIEQLNKGLYKDLQLFNIHFIDEKTKEAHLFETNVYMFSTVYIMIVIFDKFCHKYFKLQEAQDKFNLQKESSENIKQAYIDNTTKQEFHKIE